MTKPTSTQSLVGYPVAHFGHLLTFNVIPMKLFCYQTFFETWLDMNIKKCNKKMGSPCCLFTRQRALKMGYFYWLRVKISKHLHTELSLGYPKDIEFILKAKLNLLT